MKNGFAFKGLFYLLLLSLLGTQACGRKSKTTESASVNNNNTSTSSPRTDGFNDTNTNTNNNADWESVDTVVSYPAPEYNQIYTPTCTSSLSGFTTQKLQDFFFLTYTGVSSGSLKFCLSLPTISPVTSTLRLEYQHYYSQYPNTMFITRYTTKSQYLLDPSLSGGSLKLMWMNKDGFIFVRANATTSGGDIYNGEVRYTNMPSSTTADMASDLEEANCLSGATSASTCARSFVLHRSFFAKLADTTVSSTIKARIRQIIDYYYFNSYSSDFNSLGIYSTTLGTGMSFSLTGAQATTISE